MGSSQSLFYRLTDRGRLYSNLTQLYGPRHALRILASLFNRWKPHDTRFAVRLPDYPRPIFLRAHSSDVPTLRQTLIERQYSFKGFAQEKAIVQRYEDLVARGKTPLIIDCGANIGLSAIWFAKEFPAARIFAIEPSAGNFEMMKANVREFPQITPLCGAIWDREATLAISDPDVDPWEYQVEEEPSEGVVSRGDNVAISDATMSSDAVPAFTMNGIRRMAADSEGIFIAKIDIEGAEQFLFRSNTEWVSEVDVLIIELHDWMIPGEGSSNSFFRILGTLPSFDYLMRNENIFVVRPAQASIEREAERSGRGGETRGLETVGGGRSSGHRDYRRSAGIPR